MKRAILFDLGGVLIDWNPRHLYRKELGEAECEFLLAQVCTSAWNLTMDGGKPFAEGIKEKQAEWPAYAEPIGWWHTRWAEMLQGPIQGTVALLEELKAQGQPLFALTNWSAETFPIARQRYAFLGLFEHIVVSGEVGLVKPDPAIYRLAADRCGFAMTGTVFIDDSQVNVETARTLGFDAIRFTGPDQLRQELAARGLLRTAAD